jgi:hypothetical protein
LPRASVLPPPMTVCDPARPFFHFAYGCVRSKQTHDIWAAPASGGVALYLTAKRPLDRARRRSRPVRVTIAPPKTSVIYATPASTAQTIRTGALVSPACCTVAAVSTCIRSSANGSYQNPAYDVAARLQDGWDSSLVRLIRPTRHPQSHIRPGFGPEAWAKLIKQIKP